MSDKPNTKTSQFSKATNSGGLLGDLSVTKISTPFQGSDEHQKQLYEGLNADIHISDLAEEIAKRPISTSLIHSPSTLGLIVQKVRKSQKISQQEFADLAGVGRRFISELENGKATLEFGLVLQVCESAGIDILAKRR
ncbi:MAG: helix-turn-helix transcriptional regulator [Pseudomonadota bacterium]